MYVFGYDFEMAVWGESSEGLYKPDVVEYIPNFSDAMWDVLKNTKIKHPDTKIGRSIHYQIKKILERFKINTTDLVLSSAIGGKADRYHYVDGAVFVPELLPHFVTIDTFNIDPIVLLRLRNYWFDTREPTPEAPIYTDKEFHSDLFRFKAGIFACMKQINEKIKDKDKKLKYIDPSFFELIDFRKYSSRNRPENHFVLTPYYTHSYGGRRHFASLIAGYFVKVSRQGKGKNNHI